MSAARLSDNWGMQWGSVAEIVAAACTIVTVVISVVVSLQQIRERRDAQAQLLTERERSRWRDAESVSAWVHTRTKANGKQVATIHVLNASPRPVFAVTIIPTTYVRHITSQHIVCAVIGPGIDQTEDFSAAARDLVDLEEASPDIAQRIGVRLLFRDSAGGAWERDIDGRLREREANYSDGEFPGLPRA